jgi:hypothetical protein
LGGDAALSLAGGQLIRILLLVVVAFTAIQSAILIWRFGFGGQGLVRTTRFFSLDSEDNLPTFFSSCLLIGSAVLCAFTGRIDSLRKSSLGPTWYLLACTFAFLAADEATRIHEYVGHMIQRVWVHRGAVQWPWVVPYLLFAGIIAAICVPFLRRLPAAIARQCMVAGAVYVTAAAGVDMLEGYVSHAVRTGASHLQPLLLVLPIVEEPLEMVGVILFIAAILGYLEDSTDVIRVRVTR